VVIQAKCKEQTTTDRVQTLDSRQGCLQGSEATMEHCGQEKMQVRNHANKPLSTWDFFCFFSVVFAVLLVSADL
jgi:hypothetical protein